MADLPPRQVSNQLNLHNYYHLFYPALNLTATGETIYLGEQLSSDEVSNNIIEGRRLAYELCQQIDDEIGSMLNRIAGTQNMRFAVPLAGYKAFVQAVTYRNIFQALQHCSKALTGRKLECEDTLLDMHIHSRFHFFEIIKEMLSEDVLVVPCVTSSAHPPKPSIFHRIGKILNLVRKNRGKAWRKFVTVGYVTGIQILTTIRSKFGARKHAKILIYYPYLVLQNFGARTFSNYNLFFCSESNFIGKKTTVCKNEFDLIADSIRNRLPYAVEMKSEQIIRKFLVDDILREIDFCLWEKGYLEKLKHFRRKLGDANSIDIGIWSMPPVKGFNRILFEFLRSRGIPVLGHQHGGPNECQPSAGLMSELILCTDFVSYGCSEEDIRRISPQEVIPCQIHPLGCSKIICSAQRSKADFDLLFPLTNTMHLFEGGLIREKPELLLEKQLNLLEYLDGLSNVRIAVKPFPNASRANCGVYDKLLQMRNVVVLWDTSLISCIEKYRFRGVVLEHPSTPLYEVLHLDTEIFLVMDSVLKMEDLAFAELERRVHCFRSIMPMTQAIDDFLVGKLTPRRDNTYYEHYVSRPNTREKFSILLNNLVQNRRNVSH